MTTPIGILRVVSRIIFELDFFQNVFPLFTLQRTDGDTMLYSSPIWTNDQQSF